MPDSPTPKLDGLSLLLGGIKQQLVTVTETLAEDRISAAQYRTDIRKEVRELRDDVTDVKANARSVNGAVGEMKPKVDILTAEREQRVGAVRLGKWVYGAIAAVAGAGASLLVEILKGGRTPH